MVGRSPLATAARKPKSRARTSAESASDRSRSDQRRSNTLPLVTSSLRTEDCAWLTITNCANAATAIVVAVNIAA